MKCIAVLAVVCLTVAFSQAQYLVGGTYGGLGGFGTLGYGGIGGYGGFPFATGYTTAYTPTYTAAYATPAYTAPAYAAPTYAVAPAFGVGYNNFGYGLPYGSMGVVGGSPVPYGGVLARVWGAGGAAAAGAGAGAGAVAAGKK